MGLWAHKHLQMSSVTLKKNTFFFTHNIPNIIVFDRKDRELFCREGMVSPFLTGPPFRDLGVHETDTGAGALGFGQGQPVRQADHGPV